MTRGEIGRRDFRELRQDVDEIKIRSEVKRVEQEIVDLAKMKHQRSDEYQRLAAHLRNILKD